MKRLSLSLLLLLLIPILLSAQTGIPTWDDKPDVSWNWTRLFSKVIRGFIYGTNGSRANIVFYGDSLAQRKQWMMFCTLTNALPIAAVGLDAVGISGGSEHGNVGGGELTTADYDKWVTGSLFRISPGETGRAFPSPTFTEGTPWFNANLLSVCYYAGPGEGSAEVYAVYYGGTPRYKVGSINAGAAEATAVWVHYPVTNAAAYNIVITNTHPNLDFNVIGCAFADTNVSGLGLWSIVRGGATLAETTNSNPSVFSNVIAGLDADIILSEWKEGTPAGYVTNYSNALEHNYRRFTNAAPKANWLHFATHNDVNANYTDQNSATWYHCQKYKLGFVDMQRIYTGITVMSNAWMAVGDTTHANNLADLYGGAIGASSLGFPAMLNLIQPKRTIIPNMTKAQRDAIYRPDIGRMIYQTDNTPGLRVRTANGWVRFTETVDP